MTGRTRPETSPSGRCLGGDPAGDRPRHDQGESTVQLVILTPLLVLLVFLGIQAAIYFHAANVATAAASRGAAAASPRTAEPADGADAARRTIDDLGSAVVGQPLVQDANGFVMVTVTVDVARILPFFPGSVSRTALEPKERFVAESDR